MEHKDKIGEYVFGVVFIILGIEFLLLYLWHIFGNDCWNLGYTLCAARGEDYFSLYQRAFNLFNGFSMYGKEAWRYLVIPWPIVMNYFPTSAIVWGWTTIFFTTPHAGYKSYLYYSIALHLLSIYSLYYIWKKINKSFFILSLAIFFWLSFFSLNSEWVMGQFNHLAGMFFLAAIALAIAKKDKLSGIAWNLSLAWKPTALLLLPYYLKRRQKTTIAIFVLFFCVLTISYGIYYEFFYKNSLSDFFSLILNLTPRSGYDIHYIDNFSVYAFLAELFYNRFLGVYIFITKIYIFPPLTFYLLISVFIKLKDNYTKLYYASFAAATMLIMHKEVWESWLIFWLPVICILLFLAKTRKEIILVTMMGIIIGTPSLFYFWYQYKNYVLMYWLIGEKAIPQLVLYFYICAKVYKISKEEIYKWVKQKIFLRA